MIVFAAQGIINKTKDDIGWLLLRCFRSYIKFDIYLSFDVHTETTLQTTQAEVSSFGYLIQVDKQLFVYNVANLIIRNTFKLLQYHPPVLNPTLIVWRFKLARTGTFQKCINSLMLWMTSGARVLQRFTILSQMKKCMAH